MFPQDRSSRGDRSRPMLPWVLAGVNLFSFVERNLGNNLNSPRPDPDIDDFHVRAGLVSQLMLQSRHTHGSHQL